MERIVVEENIVKTGKQLFDDCFVDLNQKPKPLDVLVYIGYDMLGNRCPSLTRGEYSCILAPAKAKKTFNKSLIEAAYIGGDTIKFSDHIYGNRKAEKYVIALDTEQGEFYAYNSFYRVERMVGKRYDKYVPLQSRSKNIDERLRLIDWLIYESEFKDNIDLITVDGIADLVYDTNDLKESAKLAERMLKWTADGKLHICLVIHKNPNSDKARGHLGTAITIKAETLINMDWIKDASGQRITTNTVRVSCSHSRGASFEDFYLSVNKELLPITHNNQHDYEEVKIIKNDDEVPF